MQDLDLGLWAAIDIETSGVDPFKDSIIDVGFYQFKGLQLVDKFESLIRYPMKAAFAQETLKPLSQFIQKLTGITPSMLKRAPTWEEVQSRLSALEGHHLIAHNSDFEKSFLSSWIEKASFEDSLLYLAVANPDRTSLSLENFLLDWSLAQKEEHRGLSDARDMLRVMLLSQFEINHNPQKRMLWQNLWAKHQMQDSWWGRFSLLGFDELDKLASQIDFDLSSAFEVWQKKVHEEKSMSLSQQTDLGTLESKDKLDLHFSGQSVQKLLQDTHRLQGLFPGYRFRKSQEDMALKVGQSFKNKIHSLIQAPTGTGKTMAYLIPSALFALEDEEKVLVATGTKTLQHQALKKDLPQLKKILGTKAQDLKVVSLIGSSNHYCELIFREKEKELAPSPLAPLPDEDKWAYLYFDALFDHNNRLASERGAIDRESSASVLKHKNSLIKILDKELAVDFRACLGSRCPFAGECSYVQGLKAAKEADIIIGNHALMFTWPRAFPRPGFIVVDEAHKIEQEVTKAYSLEINQATLESFSKSLLHMQGIGSLFYLLAQNEEAEGQSTPIIRNLQTSIRSCQQMLDDNLAPLADLFETYFKKRPRYSDLYWNEAPAQFGPLPSQDTLAQAIHNKFQSIQHLIVTLEQELMPHALRFESLPNPNEQQLVAKSRFETFMGQLSDIQLALNAALDPSDDMALSWRYHESDGFELVSSPVDVGQLMHQQLLENTPSVVMTSATLGTSDVKQNNARAMEWASGHLYTQAQKRFRAPLFLPPVYKYHENAKIFLCDDGPLTFDPLYLEKTLGPICSLVRNIGGRSLFLFSSRVRFEEARERLLQEFEGEIPLFIQGMGSQVVEEFKKSGVGILLGMESFGEGIDVPGDALQFIFIDKIPDLRQDWVIEKRRQFFERHFGNEFSDYYLAHRTRSLHQKLGRLLRSELDHGAVIISDARAKRWKGATWQKFESLMAPYQVERVDLKSACQKAQEFIQHGPGPLSSLPLDQESAFPSPN